MEFLKLVTLIRDGFYGTKDTLCDRGSGVDFGKGQNVFLDLRGKSQHAHDLCHSGTGDSLLTRNLGLIGDLSGIQERAPLDGLSEEVDYPGRLGVLGGGDFPLFGRTVQLTLSADTRRVMVPILLFSKAFFGTSAISTVCSRQVATGPPWQPSTATWVIRK